MKQGSVAAETGARDLGLLDVLTVTLGGPIAWSLHLFVCYFLVSVECSTGWRGAMAGIVIATVVLAAASALTAWRALARWHAFGARQSWDRALSDPRGRGGFLWMLGALLGIVFAFAIVLAGVATFFVRTCA